MNHVPKITLPLENAIIHGIKNMGEDGIIRISGHLEEGQCRIVIEDNGFRPVNYESIHRSLHDEAPDPSLGYGIRNIQERLQPHFGSGAVCNINQEKKGNPRDDHDSPIRRNNHYRNRTGGFLMYNILVVDDEPLICKGLAGLLTSSGLAIDGIATAYSGQEALDYIRMGDIDLLVTDIQMGEMNGIELMQEAKIVKPWVQTIIISAHETFQYARGRSSSEPRII